MFLGQHIFLNTGSSGTSSMTFNYGSATATRTFDVKVTYYTCDSLNL